MSQMLKSSGAMSAATLVSRLMGMAREMVYAGFMGDTAVASAFKFAFQIPNLFRRLLGEGALTAAFIPIFKARERHATEREMWRSANAVISGLVVVASAVVGLVMLGISLYLAVGSPKGETRLMLELLRVMFPYMLIICVTAVFMGMLNARGHFFVPACGALVLNVVMIASVLWLAPRMGGELHQQVFGLAIGVLVAGVAQAAFQLPTLYRDGFRLAWVSPWKDDTVREVVRKMIPGMMGVAAFQINVVLTNAIAFWLYPPIVASFDYAVRLMELPQGLFGVSLATYLLPTLAGLAADKDYSAFRGTLSQGLGYLIIVNLLASALLLALAEPIVRLLFERGEFSPASTDRAALALACLAPGLLAFSMVNVLARAFYALGDTHTPMKISTVCLALNLLLVIVLITPFRQAGMGAANTLSALLNVGLLLYALRRKMSQLDVRSLLSGLIPGLGAAAVAGWAAWATFQYWNRAHGNESLPARLGAVFVPALVASLGYGGLLILLRVRAARETLGLFRRRS